MHWYHNTASIFKPDCGDSATLGSSKTCICSSDSGLMLVMSERLSQTTAVFSDFLGGIIQPAVTGPRNKIGADMFTELRAIPLPQRLFYDSATEVCCVFHVSS